MHQKKDGLDGREREWWVKTPAHVLRLAGTLAYLDWAMESVGTTMPAPTTIEARFVAAAVRLVTEYFWPHARAAIRQIGLTESHAKARKVLRWLRAERRDQVSIEDVRRDALQQSLNAEATEKLVEALVQAGWLRKAPIEKRGPGRHAHRWAVNPLLWTATDNSGVTVDEASGEQTRPAEIAQIAEIPPANSSEPIPAISAISATGPKSASNDGEAHMDGLALIHRARDAGLRLEVAGNALKITGPKQAEPLVRLLAKHKTQVLEALTNSGCGNCGNCGK